MECDCSRTKQGLIDLLQHPCRLIVESISDAGCPFDIEYDSLNPACGDCEHGAECHWLCSHDAMRSLHQLPTADLFKALQRGREFVAARVAHGHNHRACACENCRWLRRLRRLKLDLGDPGQ